MAESWIEQWGTYLIALAGIASTLLATLLGAQIASTRDAANRRFDIRVERARVMRVTLAEAQVAFMKGSDEALILRAATGDLPTDRLRELNDGTLAASLKLRELAAMTHDDSTVAALLEVTDRLHVNFTAVVTIHNLRQKNLINEHLVSIGCDRIRESNEGAPPDTKQPVGHLPIEDLWDRLRKACILQFDELER